MSEIAVGFDSECVCWFVLGARWTVHFSCHCLVQFFILFYFSRPTEDFQTARYDLYLHVITIAYTTFCSRWFSRFVLTSSDDGLLLCITIFCYWLKYTFYLTVHVKVASRARLIVNDFHCSHSFVWIYTTILTFNFEVHAHAVIISSPKAFFFHISNHKMIIILSPEMTEEGVCVNWKAVQGFYTLASSFHINTEISVTFLRCCYGYRHGDCHTSHPFIITSFPCARHQQHKNTTNNKRERKEKKK